MKRACMILLGMMVVLGFIFCKQSLAHMPLHPDTEAELEERRANGEDVPDFNALFQQWEEMGINKGNGFSLKSYLSNLSSSGGVDTFNVLTILIQYPDENAITNAEYFDTLVYANQQGCVTHYYLENSYGTFYITAVELPSDVGWLTSSQTSTYYTSGGDYGLNYNYPNNAQKLVEEAVDAADDYVNFANYDNDNNGYVDGLMIVHAGQGAEYTSSLSDIWSHKWGISSRLKDGVYISTYAMMPEYFLSSGDMTCGVFCHELGHVFGLPDLYDRDYESRGVGRWSVMAGGSWNGTNGSSPAHFDAWCKIQLGFASAINVTTSMAGAAIPAVENTDTIYRLWTNGDAGTEYFLVENRQRTGYDSYLPSDGLLIWHIDDTMDDGAGSPDNDNQWYPGYTAYGNYLVALEQADGYWDLEKNNDSGDSGDPFPGVSGNTAFSPLTTPNSNDYNDASTLVAITNISSSAATMYADFTVTFASDAEDDVDIDLSVPDEFSLDQNSPNPFNAETSISFTVDQAGHVDLDVYNLLGQHVTTLVSDHYEPGTYRASWDAVDKNGSEVPSGIYFYRLQNNQQIQSRKMMLLK